MSWIEIILVVRESVGWIFYLPVIVGGFYIFPGIPFVCDIEDDFAKKYLAQAYRILIPAFISLLIVCIPSVEDVWKVRIGLVKLQLASPENIQKSTEVIERLGKKLECKYLGCEDKK
jgi:hypothetical protein